MINPKDRLKPRNIQLNLSDEDCERLLNIAGKSGTTVSNLLENFLRDLVNSNYSLTDVGTEYAEDWLHHSMVSYLVNEKEENLLGYLIDNDIEVSDFILAWDQASYTMIHLQEFIETYNSDMEWWVKLISHIMGEDSDSWIHSQNVDINDEVYLCRKYVEEENNLLSK